MRASRAMILSLVGQGAVQMLRLAGNLLLSRLLFPEAFGLMALVFVVLFALEMISNFGLQPAVIRHERGDEPSFVDTAWTLQVLRGFVLWAGGIMAAPLIARVYEEPSLAQLLPVSSFAAVLMGFASTKLFTLMRRLALGRLVAIELVAHAAALVCMVGLAWQFRSVWALVAGGLVNQGTRTLLSHVWISGRANRFGWEPDDARELFSFGKWVLLSSAFAFLSSQIDVALLGRLVPVGLLGVYSIGVIIPNLLRDLAGGVTRQVLMPALSEVHRESPRALRASYAAALRVTLPGSLLAALGAVAVSPAFFGFLYDARYADAGWIAQIAVLRFWFAYLHGTGGLVLLALGDARTWALSNAVATAGVAAGCMIGFQAAALPGAIVGTGVGSVAGYAVVALRLYRLDLASPVPELGYTLLGALLAALGLGLPRLWGFTLGIDDAPLRTLVFNLGVLGPFALWTARRILREARVPRERVS
jgi:O-antigen/teichoic acid export membrane protein